MRYLDPNKAASLYPDLLDTGVYLLTPNPDIRTRLPDLHYTSKDIVIPSSAIFPFLKNPLLIQTANILNTLYLFFIDKVSSFEKNAGSAEYHSEGMSITLGAHDYLPSNIEITQTFCSLKHIHPQVIPLLATNPEHQKFIDCFTPYNQYTEFLNSNYFHTVLEQRDAISGAITSTVIRSALITFTFNDLPMESLKNPIDEIQFYNLVNQWLLVASNPLAPTYEQRKQALIPQIEYNLLNIAHHLFDINAIKLTPEDQFASS